MATLDKKKTEGSVCSPMLKFSSSYAYTQRHAHILPQHTLAHMRARAHTGSLIYVDSAIY